MLEEDLDIVITGKPSNPPMSAFVIINYLKQQGIKLAVACHKHSSLKDPVPFDLMKSIGWKNSIIQSHEKLTFTFIWKEGGFVYINDKISLFFTFVSRYQNLDKTLDLCCDWFCMSYSYTLIITI